MTYEVSVIFLSDSRVTTEHITLVIGVQKAVAASAGYFNIEVEEKCYLAITGGSNEHGMDARRVKH